MIFRRINDQGSIWLIVSFIYWIIIVIIIIKIIMYYLDKLWVKIDKG